MFFRNSVLCKRLTDNDIDKIFSTAVISENPEHNELIVTMRIIIEVYYYIYVNKLILCFLRVQGQHVQCKNM